MSEDAHFELSGKLNKQNFWYWSTENPKQIHQHPLHSENVTVSCRVTLFGIIGPYLKKMTVVVLLLLVQPATWL